MKMKNMNTNIVRRLKSNEPGIELDRVSEDIVCGHNKAVTNGFLELPMLEFVEADSTEKDISVLVAPKAGMISLSDIYNLKTAWGADDVYIHTADESIELVFKK